MSAYIVNPRTIDYLVTWARRHGADHRQIRTSYCFGTWAEIPAEYRHAAEGADQFGWRLNLGQITRDDIGQILLDQNVRSVQARYPNYPVHNQRYSYRPVPVHALRPDWVVQSCHCLRYQSCETRDYRETLAYHITQAIREDAIQAMVEAAPWGVTDEDLKRHDVPRAQGTPDCEREHLPA